MSRYARNTMIGLIVIEERDGWITNLDFKSDADSLQNGQSETELVREAFHQLDRYFEGNLEAFSLPLAPEGSPFMLKIWNLLQTIPYGETATYKEIAVAAGNPRAFRAVGLACNKNPLPLFIPCHRVIGSNGKLTGYRGGMELKRRLLELERAHAL
jgi:methylated-DNA-[protein]-cysteine S-methyltransferase